MNQHPSAWLHDWGLPDPPDRPAVVYAYRRRVQRLHPDRAGHTQSAHVAFVELQEQYGVLLEYSATPTAFKFQSPPPPPPQSSSNRSEPSPSPTFEAPSTAPLLRRGWRIPPADITLSIRWPIGLVWAGGSTTVSFLRGIPCGCGVGCARCHGTAVLLENVRVHVQIPPLPSRKFRVRLVGVAHRGDCGKQGDVWIEVNWTHWGGWSWSEEALFRKVKHAAFSPWLYVSPPGGGVARLPIGSPPLIWTSPAGLVARIKPHTVSRWSWTFLVQGVASWRWGWQKESGLKRWRSAWRALMESCRKTPRSTRAP